MNANTMAMLEQAKYRANQREMEAEERRNAEQKRKENAQYNAVRQQTTNAILNSLGNEHINTGSTLIEKATSGWGQAKPVPQQKSVRQYLGLGPMEQQEETPKPKSTLELLEQQREQQKRGTFKEQGGGGFGSNEEMHTNQRSAMQTVGDVIARGAGQVDLGVLKAIDFAANALPRTAGAIQGVEPESTFTGQLFKPITDATGWAVDYMQRGIENINRDIAEDTKDSRAAQIAADLGTGVVSALPNAALAMMTGGASAGGTIGSQLAPQASGLAGTVSAAWQKLISNPMFQTSFIQGLGSGYEEAKEAGASDVNAMAAALLSTTANSIVEVGGGVETLPGELQNADLSTGKKALQWLTSALDEGKEEVVQGAISSMVNKAASGSDTPYFSMTDENAVVNPLRMGQEFGMGAAVGGILGGGQVLANSMLQKAYANRSGNGQDAATPSQAAPDSPLGEGAQGDGIGKLDAAIQETMKPTQELNNLNNSIDGLFEQNKTAQADTGAESTNVNTNPAIHTPQEQAVIEEYQNAVDQNLVDFANGVTEGAIQNHVKYALNPVSDRAASDILRITGVDAKGFATVIEGRMIDHIVKRHGANGTADHSMQDMNDIGRIQYVLDHYDNASTGGKSSAYVTVKPNGKTGQAQTVVFEKAVNGTYYVVEAVPDTKAKTTYVVSAYMSQDGAKKPKASQTADTGISPGVDVQNENANTFGNSTVSQSGTSVNGKSSQSVLDSVLRKWYAFIEESGGLPTMDMYREFVETLSDAERRVLNGWAGDGKNGGPRSNGKSNLEQAVDALFPWMNENNADMDHGAVGAAEIGFSPYSYYQNQTSNFMPEGANAARPVDMPAVDPTGKPVRSGAKTIYGAHTTSDARAAQMESEYMEGLYGYDPVRDKPTLEKAKYNLEQEGYDRAYSRVTERLQSMKKLKETSLEAYLLYADAVKNGKDADAAELCLLLSQTGTEFGQGVQVFSMFRKLTPEGQLMGVERLVQRINKKYGDNKKRLDNEISIDENLISEFRNAPDQNTRDAVMEKIYENIGKQIPTTFSEAMSQWRYTAMLLNPSTHIKNMGGNLSMMAMKLLKDAAGTGIEKVANAASGGKVGRTKSILNVFSKSDQALMQKAWADFENVQDDVAGIGKNKDNIMGKVGEYRDYWKLNDPQGNAAKLVDGVLRSAEKVPKFNSTMMDAEDMIFSRPDYAVSLAGYMKANKLTEITPEARAYAIKEAQKATFRDANAVSNFARKMGTGDHKFWNWVASAIFPFKGTPANVGVRAFEYSPAGLLKALTSDIYRLKKGSISATEYIDNLSSGLTGSALAAVGYFLAQAGFLRATGVGDEKEKEQQRQQRYKDNSFTLFGYSIPENVFTSASAPMFVGAALYEALATKALSGEAYSIDDVLQVLAATADPILGQTMLDGLSDTFYTIRSAQGGIGQVTAALSVNIVGNYISSFIPTILSRISSAADSVGRETYADKNKPLTGIQKEAQGLIMKTPARQLLHEKVDNYGRVQETWTPFENDGVGGKVLNFAANVLTPSYPSKIKTSDVEEELNRLYQSDADTSGKKVFQTEASKSFKVDGETVNLTADQHEEFEKIRGENTLEYQGALQDSELYDNLDDTLKVYATDKMYDFIEQTSKDLLGIGYDPDDWVSELKGKSQEDIAEAVIMKTMESYAKSDNFSSKYDGITSMLDSGTIDAAMAVSMLPKEASDGYYNHIKGSGIDLSTFIDVYQFKVNSSQEEVIRYINKVGKGIGQKRRMFLAMGYSEKNLPEEWK